MSTSAKFWWGAAFWWGGIALGMAGWSFSPLLCLIGVGFGIAWIIALIAGSGGGGGSQEYVGVTSAAHQAAIDAERAAAERERIDAEHRAELARRAAERAEALRRIAAQQPDDDGGD